MLRIARLSDAEILLRWRNDPVTRHFRDDPRPVSLEEHQAWLDRRINGLHKVYIFELDGVPVGNITLDPDGEIGWIVAPEKRRCGVGKLMVQGALGTISPPPIWAKMRHDNIASSRTAIACGSSFREQIGNMLYFERARLT